MGSLKAVAYFFRQKCCENEAFQFAQSFHAARVGVGVVKVGVRVVVRIAVRVRVMVTVRVGVRVEDCSEVFFVSVMS